MKRYAILALTAVAGLLIILVEPDAEDAGNMILGGISATSWLFILMYMSRSDWAATAPGRAVLRLVLCIAMLCTQGVATILTGYSYPGRDVIRPVLLLLILITLVDFCVTLRRYQRAEPARPPEPGP